MSEIRLPIAPSSDAFRAARADSWRPGLTAPARQEELFAPGRDASGAGLALALACDRLSHQPAALPQSEGAPRAWLWVQDRAAIRLGGRPYGPGLPPRLRKQMIHVVGKDAKDALFALEEAVRCRDIAFVVGEIAGDPKALDFTASRRLALAAERHGVPLFLVRLDARRNMSAARMRWQVRSAASPPSRDNAAAPGPAGWHAELFRSRGHPPGEWVLCWDGEELAVRPEESPNASQQVRDHAPRGVSPRHSSMRMGEMGG